MKSNRAAGSLQSFFSVPFELVKVGEPLPYDLFINSSSRENREKFVRIYPAGDPLEAKDIASFKEKYHQLYVSEKQRHLYLTSITSSELLNDNKKTEVIKEVAIHYLDNLFDDKKTFTTELLQETIEGCRDAVASMVEVVQDYSVDQIQKLIGEMSFHDFYTYDHSINVSMYCIALLRAYNPKATKEEVTAAGLGGLLHDLGKIKIPTDIINNPAKLTDAEFQEIMKHPGYGLELLDEQVCQSCKGVDIGSIKRVVYEHHENFNGTGYPNKIAGDNIHLLARITSIADFFDAITTKRSYHEVLSTEDALEVMNKTAGKKIDPKLFEIFTTKVKNLVLKGKSNVELEDNFDPCQPHQTLPLLKIKPKKQEHNLFEKKQDFGKVSAQEKDKDKKKAS